VLQTRRVQARGWWARRPRVHGPATGRGPGWVVLDATVTPEPRGRGLGQGPHPRNCRSCVSPSGLTSSDRISVVMVGAGATGPTGQTPTADLIAGEILATSFEFGEPTDGVQNRPTACRSRSAKT